MFRPWHAGTVFKSAGERADKLAVGLRAVERLIVGPKLAALAEASERLAGAGGRMRTAGTGAVELASGLKAVDAVNAEHLGIIAGAVERLSKASGEGKTASDLKTMGSSIDGAAGGAEKLATTLGQVQERLSSIASGRRHRHPGPAPVRPERRACPSEPPSISEPRRAPWRSSRPASPSAL